MKKETKVNHGEVIALFLLMSFLGGVIYWGNHLPDCIEYKYTKEYKTYDNDGEYLSTWLKDPVCTKYADKS